VAAILIVDADPTERDLFRVALESRGHAVIVAGGAIDAIERLREGGIDLVIHHHQDPGQTRALAEGLERLPDAPPFVMISGAIDAPTLSARLGAAAFVAHPCGVDDLIAPVDQVLLSRYSVPKALEEIPTRPNERE
jgi:DNA-binding NtrC family response regulator